MTNVSHQVASVARLRTGIPGLDRILGGGLFQSGVYMIQGLPGCGKTILANQICYSHVKEGGKAIYVTLLAESHSRMIQHLSTLTFFDVNALPSGLSYISAFHELETGGLKGLMSILRREMKPGRGILVLDGLVTAEEAAPTDLELKKFVHELQGIAELHECTVLLLTSGYTQRMAAEHTMVDGIIEVEDKLFDVRTERSIQIKKFRGAGPLRGKHAMRIDQTGISVFPRIETLYGGQSVPVQGRRAVTSGVPSLDQLLAIGGIPAASATVALGSTGTGKTTMGIHFIAASSAAEPGLHLGFFEAPDRLRAKARSIGQPLEALEAAGCLELMWQTPGEFMLDEIGDRLLAAVDRTGARRLVIDGLSGFLDAAIYPERINRYFSSLVAELRSRQVTTFMTLETRDALASVVSMPWGVSGLVDNLFFLRFVHDEAQVERLLTIIKVRDTDHHAELRRLQIGATGLRVCDLLAAAGDVIPMAAPAPETRADGGAGSTK